MSKAVIPKPFLCGSLVSLSRPRATVLGFPLLLRNPKYHRNALLFNFGFVLAPRVPSEPYQLLLRKATTKTAAAKEKKKCLLLFCKIFIKQVAETLRAMEEESGFVSDSKNVPIIEKLCSSCLRDLNSVGECAVVLDAGNTVFLKLQKKLTPDSAPSAHRVPVAVVPLTTLDTASWDLTVRRVALAIDGFRCVRDISRTTGVDVPLVAQAVRTLMVFGCVAITEPWLACNRFACTPLASSLCWSELGRACCSALGVPISGLPRVALLYARLRPSESLASTLKACGFPEDRPPFDIQRFICFGLLNGVIRRVQPYVYSSSDVEGRGVSIDEYLVSEGLPLDDKNFALALERFTNESHVILWK